MNNIEEKYFIDDNKYNCPFCKTRSVAYKVLGVANFDEKSDKKLQAIFVKCNHDSCNKVSMHLTKSKLGINISYNNTSDWQKRRRDMGPGENFVILNDNSTQFIFEIKLAEHNNIDDYMMMHIPTSFFTIDNRIPKKLRDLIHEAEKCVQNNCLTGASACIRKTIYEFVAANKLVGENYDDKIKSLKEKYPTLDDLYITMLSGIKGITSDQVHEDSYHDFKNSEAKGYIEILKEILNEIYVIPEERKLKNAKVGTFFGLVNSDKEAKSDLTTDLN